MITSAFFALPDGFSWLVESCRPSPQEVENYARVIAATEGAIARSPETLRREAELQLWIWRTENQRSAAVRRRPPARGRRRG